jgi:hypothetical protein
MIFDLILSIAYLVGAAVVVTLKDFFTCKNKK